MSIPAVYKDPSTGKYVLHEAVLFTRPYWLTTWPAAAVVLPAALGIVGSSAMRVPQEAPFVGEKFLVFRTTQCMIKILDGSTGRYLTNDWIHIDSIAGTAQFPFLLQDPLYLEAESYLHVEYMKLAPGGAADVVDFHVEGTRYYVEDANIPELTAADEKMKRKLNNNYLCIKTVNEQGAVVPGLQLPGVILGALGQATYTVTVPRNYHFTVRKVTAVTAAGALPPAFSIRYYDQRGNELGNGALDSRAVMGTGLLPELLSQPFTVPENRQFSIVVTDLSGAPNNFFITFTGAAHYVTRKP